MKRKLKTKIEFNSNSIEEMDHPLDFVVDFKTSKPKVDINIEVIDIKRKRNGKEDSSTRLF